MKIAACFTGLITVIIIFKAGATEKEKGLEDDAGPRQKGNRKPCRAPWGKHGKVLQDGCLSRKCKNGKWNTVMRKDVCCFNRQAFPVNTIIESEAQGNCSQQITCDSQAKLTFTKPTCSAPDIQDILGGMERKLVNLEKEIKSSMDTLNTTVNTVNTLNTSMNTLNTDVNTLNTSMNTLNTDVNTLNTDVHICVYKATMQGLLGAITYTGTDDKTLTNIASDGASIDTSSGIFTVRTTGVYTITYSTRTYNKIVMYIYVDNREISSTKYSSYQPSWTGQGSMTVTLCLRKGQTVNIGVTRNSGDIQLTWCISLEKKMSC